MMFFVFAEMHIITLPKSLSFSPVLWISDILGGSGKCLEGSIR
uniref:Uncharacterized protein n=1 Tax=Anguilla anguilla TaxID=7936 RepID=A0A0E9QTH5_ANGAN